METWHETRGITWVHRDHPEPQPGREVADGIASAPLPAYPEGVEPLRDTTLGDGECLDGTVGFQVPPGTQDVGIAVRCSNLLGDRLTWRAEG